jgi:hypothetical protein
MKSYWYTNFLTGDDGHEYCIVATSANAGPINQINSISLMDITTGYHFGGSYSFPGQVSTTVLEGITPILHVGAYIPDQYYSLFAISTLPEAPFNLTYAPRSQIPTKPPQGHISEAPDMRIQSTRQKPG